MTAYTKSTNFATKDTLTSGDPLKIVRGTEINTEFDNIQTAVNSKADTASPTFTGTITAATVALSGPLNTDSTTDSTSTTTGSIQTDGGVGIAKALYVGTTANVGSTTDSSSTSTGAIVTAGGLGVAKAVYVGTTLNVAGNTILGDASTDTLNVGNGGLVKDASGNVGIGTSSPARKLHVSGGDFQVDYAYASSGTSFRFLNSATPSDGVTLAADYYGSGSYGPMKFFTSNTERMRIDSSGNLLVGTTSSTGRIGSKAATTDNTGYGIYVEDSAFATMFYARNDGVISTGAKSASPYNNTTASAANMFVSSAGILQRSTSSLKYKTNVQDATHGLTELLTLRPVTYEGKTDGDKVFGGLIAEEVHEAGLTEFVQYAEDGSPDALNYGNMVSLCIKAIQEQQALIQTLTDRITALEGAK